MAGGAVRRTRSAATIRRQEVLRESFVIIPCLFLFGGFLLALLTSFIDAQLHLDPAVEPILGRTAEDARAVVSSVPAATLTFIAVVFSVALVALQLRSNQYSPRVLRGFIRARTSKVALGIYLATFVYSFLTLADFDTEAPDGSAYIPILSVVVCEVLVLASLVVFVLFVNEIIRSMRVSSIVDDIARETRAAIDDLFPIDDPSADAVGTFPAVPSPHAVGARHRGVLAAVDRRQLLEVCGRHDTAVRLLVSPGDYVARGEVIAEVHGPEVPAAVLDAALVFAGERTLYQDPAYGIRLLVDVAIRALSPAINDPSTAVQCIDRLTDLLLRAGLRHDPSPLVVDATGTVRVQWEAQHFDDLCRLAFSEIRQYGADSPQIPRRLASGLAMLRANLPERRWAAVDDQRALLAATVDATWPDAAARVIAGTPDRRGLG